MYTIANILDETQGREVLTAAVKQGLIPQSHANQAIVNATECGWYCDDWKQVAGLYGKTVQHETGEQTMADSLDISKEIFESDDEELSN